MKYIFGNWKMNGLRSEAIVLANATAAMDIPENAQVAIFPPFAYLYAVLPEIINSKVKMGGQDCSIQAEGAFTGEVSAAMLKDSGCSYVLVGHSERRLNHYESNELVRQKASAAIAAGIIPVICVGESLNERESGKYLEAITSQVKESVPENAAGSQYIIAYEPVWAIGSGKTPTTDDINEVHKTIASLLTYATSVSHQALADKTAVVYGGSVKAANAREIMASDLVDGVLVGGASLKADEFGKIIESVRDIA